MKADEKKLYKERRVVFLGLTIMIIRTYLYAHKGEEE